MKIAQIAPLFESVPPKTYGGTERVVSYLTEALVDLGHDVTLYASGDSKTRARLREACHRALRLDPESIDTVADHVRLVEWVMDDADEFDFIHSHIDCLAYPVLRRIRTPHVTTLHGRLDIPNLNALYREFREIPLVSISNYQRLPLSWANWQATVHHGLPESLLAFHEPPGEYLAFVGRISPEKGIEDAIAIARRAGMPLKIAAKVDRVDREYFQSSVRPLLDGRGVEFVGEIGEDEKDSFLGNARALLFPVDWPEPFGLVMIEALACGTPVVARLSGAVPEVIHDGETGFVVRDTAEAVRAVASLDRIDRARCRAMFEERFTAARMARDYVDVYQMLIAAKQGASHESCH